MKRLPVLHLSHSKPLFSDFYAFLTNQSDLSNSIYFSHFSTKAFIRLLKALQVLLHPAWCSFCLFFRKWSRSVVSDSLRPHGL